jgi:hypothetical protein
MLSQILRALISTFFEGSTRPLKYQGPSSTTLSMNSELRRTELLEDCPLTVP